MPVPQFLKNFWEKVPSFPTDHTIPLMFFTFFGATFVVTNLTKKAMERQQHRGKKLKDSDTALAFARKGKPVIDVDADMRQYADDWRRDYHDVKIDPVFQKGKR